mmetsp:Transcript_7312/g.13879  ORF Transcript_7312/g.13879 Transcript_7312/m.13879 type:complete len:113 (+) Transcript_7312:219-557(+)
MDKPFRRGIIIIIICISWIRKLRNSCNGGIRKKTCNYQYNKTAITFFLTVQLGSSTSEPFKQQDPPRDSQHFPNLLNTTAVPYPCTFDSSLPYQLEAPSHRPNHTPFPMHRP